MAKLLIYGSKDFGSVLKRLALQCGHEFLGFIDDWNVGPEILGTFEAVSKKFPSNSCKLVLAIGYKHLAARRTLQLDLHRQGYEVHSLIHPGATVSSDAQLAPGVVVMAGAVIDSNAELQSGCVVWPGAVVNHDSTVGANSFISPNATLCGYVTVGESCFVGAGSVVVDHTNVPSNTFIKAGSVYFRR